MAKITVEQAMDRLVNLSNQNNGNVAQPNGMRMVRKAPVQIEFVKELSENVLMFKKDGQYILSPADDELEPIMAELDSAPNDEDLPPSFAEWINGYDNEIKDFQNQDTVALEAGEDEVDFVDLGLSVRWAKMNLGANSLEELGDYYAWGEVETKTNYTIAEYKYYDATTKTYKDLGRDISNMFEYDVAHKTKRSWCLPTLEQVQELINKCTWEKGLYNNKSVWIGTGPNGNQIYFPFNGCKTESSKTTYTYYNYTWTANDLGEGSSQAKCLKFTSKPTIYYMYKRTGAGIRPVESKEYSDETQKGNIKMVDLGLSVDWADMNIGANKPEDYGDYYAWGELQIKDKYTWDAYKHYDKENSTSSSPKTLDLGSCISQTKYDKAFSLDSSMCLPTAAQWQELLTKCTITNKTLNDVRGVEVVGPNGKSIFLPFTGYIVDSKTYVGTAGFYMSGSIYSTNTNQYAKSCDFREAKAPIVEYTRKRAGLPIRPVSTKQKNTKKTIEPLIPFKWGQGAPYNNLLPTDTKTGNKVITGCNATAIAQIIAYWGCVGLNGKKYKRGCPKTKAYTSSKNGCVVKIPALEPIAVFDYNNFLLKKAEINKSEEAKTAICTLMKHIGYSLVSSYSSTSTTASVSSDVSFLKNSLKFGNNIKLVLSTDDFENWLNLVYNNLEKKQPVIIAGWSNDGTSGHAFICDGYNKDTDKYHFNWGWDGSYDGWYPFTALKLSNGYDFNYYKKAILNICPEKIAGDVNEDGIVDINDIINIVNDIISRKFKTEEDINSDNVLDEKDIKMIIDIILAATNA